LLCARHFEPTQLDQVFEGSTLSDSRLAITTIVPATENVVKDNGALPQQHLRVKIDFLVA